MIPDKPVTISIDAAPPPAPVFTEVPPGGEARSLGSHSRALDTLDVARGARRQLPRKFLWPRPWPSALMPRTRQGWADALWYLGHVMAIGSLISRYSLPTAALLVSVGQLMVIVSRPLGRGPAPAPVPVPRAADDSV